MRAACKVRLPSPVPAVREGRLRQRQRLIDACISALHIYGPSRTTVGKVVAFAKMSPGIVRFYFDSKAAMLVASLQYLATEFEQQVLIPVGRLRATPVAALQLLVDSILDADFASPRKVSAWYTFWGEASSRQEYYDICGQKDESFARLVHELIAALIVETRQPRLDADGVALGLIGVLEILWQDIAFQTERDIDRPAAKRRCMAYLRSLFPGCFDAVPATVPNVPAVVPPSTALAARAYADPRLFAQERERLFSASWTLVGHESQIAATGDFLAIDAGTERALIVRGPSGTLHAFRNSCSESPHALGTARNGHFDGAIECRHHGVSFSLDGGRPIDAGRSDLKPLDLRRDAGLLFVRAHHPSSVTADGPGHWFAEPPTGMKMVGAVLEFAVAADWKLIVEQWLEGLPPNDTGIESEGGRCAPVWREPVAARDGWSAARYRRLLGGASSQSWRRRFVAPHQLIEERPDGISVVQVLPTAAGHCTVRRLDCSVLPSEEGASAARYLAGRLSSHTRMSSLVLAESLQAGRVEFGYGTDAGAADTPAAAWFRRYLVARLTLL